MIEQSSRDEPGRKRQYETIFILRAETPNDSIGQVNQRIRSVIEQGGGKLLKIDNWGKRKLAYEVRKQLKGIYLYWQYLGSSGLVKEVERNLRMLDSVVRYYTTLTESNVDPEGKATSVTDESFAAAATTGPDEEEIATGAAVPRSFAEDDDDFEIDYAAEEAALARAAEETAAAAETAASAAKDKDKDKDEAKKG